MCIDLKQSLLNQDNLPSSPHQELKDMLFRTQFIILR